MAAPAWFAAGFANITAPFRAARTSGYCNTGSTSPQLAGRSGAGSLHGIVQAPALGVAGRAVPMSNRRLCWTAQEQSCESQELRCSCCSRRVLRQRQQQWRSLPIHQNCLQVSCGPRDCCGPPGAACASSLGGRLITLRRLYLSSSANVNTEFPNTVAKCAGAALHVASTATSDQEPRRGGSSESADADGNVDFTHATSKQKLAAVMLLRRRSGGVSVGKCFEALEATNGDTEAAVVHLRKQGLSRGVARCAADCREGLVAVGFMDEAPTAASSGAAAIAGEAGRAAGRIRRLSSVLVGVTSQTDFVAANARFVALAQQVANAAARTAVAAAARADSCTVLGATQNADCSSATAPKADDFSKCEVKTLTAASLLEEVKAAGVTESVLTMQEIDSADVAAAEAVKRGASVPEAAASRSADAAVFDKNMSLVRGSCSSDNGLISVSSALTLLSQQFGESVQLSGVKALVVEAPDHLQQRQGETHSDSYTASSNVAVGVYVHGQIAKNVGRAAAMVCLRWRRELSSGHTTAAEAQQLQTITHRKIERLAQLLCMQVIATRPRYTRLSDISTAEKNAERQILAPAAASAAKRRAPAGGTVTPAAGPPTLEGDVPSWAENATRQGSFTYADAAAEARLEGTLREQTLLEQEFLPLSRFYAEVLDCDGITSNSCNMRDKSHQSSCTTVNSVTNMGGTTSSKSSADSVTFASRLTVKEAIQRATVALRCSTIDIESMQFVSVGQS